MKSALNIDTYKADGFVKVCDVRCDRYLKWYYQNINESLMYSTHNSWVYFIVVNKEIVKVGETGNPLGLPSLSSNQPRCTTKGRFSRYRMGDGTDEYIRRSLITEANAGIVSLWVRACKIVELPVTIAGTTKSTFTKFHKDLEMKYLDHIYSETGNYPALNTCRK